MRPCFASLIVVAVSLHASAVPTTNSNGSVMTPNSELTRNQLVATDVSGLLSSESDPNVVFTNGELLVHGERVKIGPDETEVQEIANAAVETNALTVATTNRVALLESSKAEASALETHVANTNNPHGVTAAQVGAVGIGDSIEIKSTVDVLKFSTYYSSFGVELSNSNYGDTYHAGGYSTYRPYIQGINGHYSYYTIQIGGSPNPSIGEDGGVFIFDNYDMTRYGHHAIEQWRTDGSLETLMYFPIGQQGTIALQNWQSLSAMLDSTNATTLAENPTFSNAVLAVGLNIDTNSVAVLNDIAATFGGFPLGAGETATTVGALLAALAAAVAWLKKNKVQTLKLNDGSVVKTAENGVAKLDDFFTESNSLLNGRLAYSRNATGLKDRAFNTLSFDGTEYNLSTALAAVTPTASGQPRDLLIVATATAATTISFTAGTIKGDKPTIDGSGTWLITLTEYASGVWYCRQIKMEDAA